MSSKKRSSRSKFTMSDYNSNDGMMTSIFGPATWHLLHCMSFNYPENPTECEKRDYMDFVLSLKNILPCGKCRTNLEKNFIKLPISMKEMESRDTFSRYIYGLHEVVNNMLGKKSGLTYAMVRETYEHFRARCVKDPKTEVGCVVPLQGKKTKCILRIVPQSKKCKTFSVESHNKSRRKKRTVKK
jgi:Erv1 / Alr family